MPKISVIIPVYNAEKTIRQTVLSVLNQTFKDFELIIINDGSTDNTVNILQKISDPRVFIHNFPNRGLSASRNRGIKLASGDYISFIDSDDLWTECKLEHQYNKLRSEKNSGLVYSWTVFIDESGRYLSAKTPNYNSGFVFRDLFISNFIASGSNVMIRRRCLEEIEWFDESLDSGEDLEFFFRFARNWRFSFVPAYQVLYRFRNNSMSSSISKTHNALISIIEKNIYSDSSLSITTGNKAKAGIYLHLCFLSISRTKDAANLMGAIGFLGKALRSDYRILFTGRTISLFVTIFTACLLPTNMRKPFIKKWIQIHGKIIKAFIPELTSDGLKKYLS